MRLFALFALFAALSLPGISSAQSFEGTEDPGAAFSMTASPEFPEPYGKASLSFVSSVIDLNAATLSVLADGKKVYQGSVRPVEVALGKAGSITRIVATITANGAVYEKTLVLQPQDVVLVVEPLSSAPPLYPGKPVVPLEGSVRVVAVANFRTSAGALVDPDTLSYAWTVDDTKIFNASGIGKRALVVASPLQYRSRQVSVVVMRTDATLVGGASVTISPLEPSVRIYKSDPLLGVRFDRAILDSFIISSPEASFYAAPFGVATASAAPFMQWFLNGEFAQTGNTITLRPTDGSAGRASLSFVAEAAESVRATTNISLVFGERKSNFFGL